MVVLVTLNSGQGVNLGPNFTLSANTGTITPATATLAQLLAGIYVTVDNAAVSVTITSTGSCTNSLVINITSITTTTTTTTAAPTTTTTTTTAAPTTTTTTTSAPTTTTTSTSTTTTTAAPTTTTTTTSAPTTTTTSTSTTTTSTTTSTTTTTLAPVSFSTSGGCANFAISDGVGAMVSFNGGSGVYQASDVTYSTQVAAENGIYTNVSVSRTFTGLAAGTYWVALRDTNDTSNKKANSFAITTCPTTTTTTQAPVSATVSGACTGDTQTITVNSFTGGDGSTYYVSNATYGDAGSAGAATANVLVSGGTYSYASQPSGTRYVKIASTIRTNVVSGGSTCTTTSTTTTTTTLAPFSACMSDYSDSSACYCDGLSYGTWTFYGSGNSICTSSTITSTGILSEITNNGFFWIASGGNVRYYQKNGASSSATAQAACYACPTTTTTTTIAPTTTTTTVAVEWYDLLLCSNLTTHKTSEQYTTGTFVINERVETVFPIDTYRIVGVYTTNPGGVKDLIVPTGFTGCPTTTTTTTAAPTTTTTTTASLCTCKQGTIQDNNAFSYTDCAGVFQSGSFEQGSEVCVDINQFYSSNIGNLIDFVGCACS